MNDRLKLPTRWLPRKVRPAPPVQQLPAGLELPDGRLLTFAPHRECPCSDCEGAFRALEDGTLRMAEAWDGSWP